MEERVYKKRDSQGEDDDRHEWEVEVDDERFIVGKGGAAEKTAGPPRYGDGPLRTTRENVLSKPYLHGGGLASKDFSQFHVVVDVQDDRAENSNENRRQNEDDHGNQDFGCGLGAHLFGGLKTVGSKLIGLSP